MNSIHINTNKVKHVISIISCFLFTLSVSSQNIKPNNYLIIELGGSGNILSINYERNIFQIGKHIVQPKIGLFYFPLYVNGESTIGTISCIMGLKYLYRMKDSNHFIETGIDNILSLSIDNKSYNKTGYKYHYSISPSVGYRFEKQKAKTMVYYLGYSPKIYQLKVPLHGTCLKYQHYIKIGIGYKF